MFAKYLMEWGIRQACTGIPAMYNALRYSLLFVTYITYWIKIFDPRYLVTDPQNHGSCLNKQESMELGYISTSFKYFTYFMFVAIENFAFEIGERAT